MSWLMNGQTKPDYRNSVSNCLLTGSILVSMKSILLIIIIVLVTIGATLFITRDKDANNISTTSNASSETARDTTASSGKILNYANKGLTEFPKAALSEKSATELNLSGNNLTGSLPSQIKELKNLEILNVSNNNMTGIPAEIGQMTKLRVINYANNGITGLPNELGNLKNLEILDLSGNNPSELDLNQIRSNLPSTVQIIL